METDVAQHLAGVLVVARELRATKVMVPGVDGVNTLTACFLLQKLLQLSVKVFRHSVFQVQLLTRERLVLDMVT